MGYNIINVGKIMKFFKIFKSIKKALNPIAISSTKNSPNQKSKKIVGISDLSSLIKDAIPSKNGLYPHEILMLYYASNYKTTLNDNIYQSFWLDKYYVDNPTTILKSLVARGFINIGDISQTIEKLTMSELKANLASINQKTNGSKQELINRILTNIPENILSKRYPQRYFKLTDLGQQELSDNQYIPYLHKNDFLNIWELNKLAPNEKNYRDLIWEYFNKKSLEETSNYNFGLYRNIRFNMGLFLLEENKIKEALYFFCEVFKYDNCLLDNSTENLLSIQDKKNFLILLNSEVNLFFTHIIQAPKLLEYFLYIQKKLEISTQEFQEILYNNFKNIQTEFCMFTEDELVKIIKYEINKENDNLNILYNTAKKRELQKIIDLKEKFGCENLDLDKYNDETTFLLEKYGL